MKNSRKKKLYCKYCHFNTHTIDFCPEIICRNCQKKGHPDWKCETKFKKIERITPIEIKTIEITEEKNLSDYTKYLNDRWVSL